MGGSTEGLSQAAPSPAPSASEGEKLRFVLDYAPVGIWLQDGSGKLEFVNKVFCDAMGIPEARFLAAAHYQEVLPAPYVPQCLDSDEKALASKGVSVTYQQLPFVDGRVHDLRVIKAVHRDESGKPLFMVGIAQDVSEEFRQQRQLHEATTRIQHISLHDALTDLPNRIRFLDRLDQAVARARKQATPVVLYLIGLDNFSHINDSHGHPLGDRLLEVVAKRLRGLLPEADMVARLGGDEFVVLREGAEDSLASGRLAESLLDAVARPIGLNEGMFHMTASIGVALFPDDADNGADLLRNGDAALNAAKREARGHYRFYSPRLGEWVSRRARLENNLRVALRREELALWYQPQVETGSGQVVGLEALLRWNHPDLGWIPPDQFIPVAEEARLIVPLGVWVLREACMALVRLQSQGLAPPRMAVNVSPLELHYPDYAHQVSAMLAATGLSPGQLELEMTERAILSEQEEVQANLAALGELGVRIAIDDFGTGYSSLALLRKLRVDCLKIDRAFVESVPQDADARAVIHAVLAMSQALRLEVVAEGVENEEQAAYLEEERCTAQQGYYYARPMPEENLVGWLRSHLSA